MEYRAHLQAFIDRWRYNANRAAQAQSKIKVLEKLPDLEAPQSEETEKFRYVMYPVGHLDDVANLWVKVPGDGEDLTAAFAAQWGHFWIHA